MALGKEALSKPALKRETLSIPEWGGDVIIRELSVREQAELAAMRKGVADDDVDAGSRALAQIVGHSWVDETGSRILSTQEEIDTLLDQPVGVLNAIASVAMRLSGAEDGAAAVEDAKKNSTVTQSGVSGSASPSPSAAAQ